MKQDSHSIKVTKKESENNFLSRDDEWQEALADFVDEDDEETEVTPIEPEKPKYDIEIFEEDDGEDDEEE